MSSRSTPASGGKRGKGKRRSSSAAPAAAAVAVSPAPEVAAATSQALQDEEARRAASEEHLKRELAMAQGRANLLEKQAKEAKEAEAQEKKKGQEEEGRDKARKDKKDKKKKKKSSKKRKRKGSDSDSDSSSDSDSDSSSSSGSDSSSGGSDSDSGLPTRKELTRLYDKKVDGSKELGRNEAEARSCMFALLAARRLHDSDVKADKKHKPQRALQLLMAVTEARARGLVAFAAAKGSSDPETRVKKLLAKVRGAAGGFDESKKIKAMAKEMLPIGSGLKGKKRPWQEDTTPSKRSKGAEGTLSQRMAQMEEAQRLAPASSASAASAAPQLDMQELARHLQMAQQQQQQRYDASSMPTRNEGFRAGGDLMPNGKPRMPPGSCFECGQRGHRKEECPVLYAKMRKLHGEDGPAAKREPPPLQVSGEKAAAAAAVRERQAGRQCPGNSSRSSAADPLVERQRGTAVAGKEGSAGKLMEQGRVDVLCSKQDEEAVPRAGTSSSSGSHTAPSQVECKCGHCGSCVAGIDIMQKEQREQLGPARLEAARRIEQEQRKFDAMFAAEQVNPNNSIAPSLKAQAEEMFEEDARMRNWTLEDDEPESEQEQRRESPAGGPPMSTVPLRKELATNGWGKKAFNKHDPARKCWFCKKSGHRRQECMLAPAPDRAPSHHPAPTPLQQAKRDFVLGLMHRERAPDITTLGTPEDGTQRLPAVKRAMALGEEANRGNPWAQSNKRRDKLRKSLGHWWAIGADATVLSWIGFGVKLHLEREPKRVAFGNHRSYHTEKQHIQKEHDMHVADGSFRIGRPEEVRVGNPLQVEVNEKGKRRSCLDCRYTNAFLADYAFTQETLNKHVAQIVKRFMLMITTDVAKAYYQVALHKDSQAYCAWRHNGEWILPTILPFGLSIAPFVFTKIMRVVLRFMRAQMIHGTNCIDDNLWAEWQARMQEVKDIVQLVFGLLGWTFNEKCVFEPSTTVLYNGMWVDSARFEIRATDEKLDAARRLAWKLWYAARDGQPVLLNDLQKLTGRLQSIKLAIEGVAVWTRGIYADIAWALERTGQKPPRGFTTLLRYNALADLNFWALRLGKQNGLPINDEGTEVHLTMHTDASDVGWGAHTDVAGSETAGELPLAVLGSSSTAREIAGVLEAATRMAGSLRDRRVRLCMDSLPAICNFVNGGGPVEELNALVKQWWVWCRQHRVTPLYHWVRREQNQQADDLSKQAAAAFTLRLEAEMQIRAWLDDGGLPGSHRHQYARTRVIAPRLDTIGVRIQEMQRAKKAACIVVPKWASAPWRVHLNDVSTRALDLGRMKEVLAAEHFEQGEELQHARWGMEAHVIGGGGKPE